MSSVQSFRDFICERLTAAAVEIFTAYEQTVAQYESEISRQRKLLDNNWTSPVEVHRTETPQKNVCQDVEVLSEQRLPNNERRCSADQDEPEPACIKEEPDEQGSDQEEPLPIKLETDNNPSIHPSSPPPYPVEDYTDNYMEATTDEEQNGSDHESDSGRLRFHNTPTALNQNQKESHHLDSTSSTDAAVRPTRRPRRSVVSVAPVSESQCDIKPRKKTRRRNVNGKARVGNPRRKRSGRIHTDEKPCCCEACGKGFRDNYTLSVHMRTHTGEKPYVCNTCGKCYRNRHGLVNHMRNHTGEKPYVCKTCGKCYKHSSGLSYHRRNHTAEAVYSCKICGENFRESCDLLVHMSTHTVKNLYSCKDCGKKFRLRRDLLAHMRTHTGETLYPCPQCHKTFSLSRYLIVHMRTHR
ncbi:zinc finger protein 37-like [Salarias fasciatus]|uniref:Zinc finger protein 37-like n=1 Tax=Salarias fasciatus TaxID=181472 RepID=A0A672F4D5_SALFA|nr:zinc finger protein 37-like [Salarias fasciatus]